MTYHQTVKLLPEEERPYEKCLSKGPQALSDAELLAVVIRSGARGITSIDLAREVLRQCPYEEGLDGILHLDIRKLIELPGIGKVKAVQIQCIGELSKRIAGGRARRKLDFRSPACVADYYMEQLRHEEQETVICMMLDTATHLLGERQLTRGTVNQSLLSPREVFLAALEFHAVQIILVHNHPSGDPEPSREDILVTKRIQMAGELIGICLLDHIVIGDRRYTSIIGGGALEEADIEAD